MGDGKFLIINFQIIVTVVLSTFTLLSLIMVVVIIVLVKKGKLHSKYNRLEPEITI